MSETNGYGSLSAPPTELSRLLKLLIGKGGAGDGPFEKVDIEAVERDGIYVLSSEHANRLSTQQAKTEFYGATGKGALSFGLDKPTKMIDYIDGLFVSDVPVELGFDPSLARIDLANGDNRVSLSTVAIGDIPRSKMENRWGIAPDGTWVSSQPEVRPPDGSPWAKWVEAGYLVVEIPVAFLNRILAAGSILSAHSYKNSVVRFRFSSGVGNVEIGDPKEPTAETVRIGFPSSVIIPPGVEDAFPVAYAGVSALWESIRNAKVDTVTLVHFAGKSGKNAESRVNLSLVEKGEAGEVRIRHTLVFAIHKDKPVGKKAAE
jgi:hypothetical protein